MITSGLKEENFIKVAPNGLGEPDNSYPHSMTWFRDRLYVGTTRNNLVARGVGQDPQWVGEVWPVRLPGRVWDLDMRGQIWRYDPGTREWEKVFTSPLVQGKDGYLVPMSVGFRNMTAFQGASDPCPVLYVPTWATHQRPETLILRSEDGKDFSVVSQPGLGLKENTPRTVRALIPFKGRLFTAPAMGQKRRDPNSAGGALVLVSQDPARGEWRLANAPSFGNPNNQTAFQMAEFNGCLYAGTMNAQEGYEVWKTDAEGDPPYRWTRVIRFGAYRGKANQIAMTLRAFGDHLYIGSAIQHGGIDYDNRVGPEPPEIIRLNRDDSWDLLVGQPRKTPQGLKIPLSGKEAGFGNPFAGYIWSFCEHQGWLYAGNAVWSAFLKFGRCAGSASLAGKTPIVPAEYRETIVNKFGGCDVWRTSDGVRWVPVTSNGFGNYYNIGIRNMVSTPHGLFVGAANPFGPQVAVRRKAGWTYEPNPKGGLEIWLGDACHAGRPEARGGQVGPRLGDAPGRGYQSSAEEVIREFYAGSGFSHIGFWSPETSTPLQACENLMDEVLAFIPDSKGSVLDVGCRTGATTRYLLRYFPQPAVAGVTGTAAELEECRRTAPGVAFYRNRLPELNMPAASFDHLICIEGPGRFGSYWKLFKGAGRVLRPGGRFVFADILYADSAPGGFSRLLGPGRHWPSTPSDYQGLLEKAGFANIRIEEVTPQCIGAFSKSLHRYLAMKKFAREIDEQTAERVIEMLSRQRTRSVCYSLVAATRASADVPARRS